MNIVLIGFMGTGKTSVGKRVAEQLEMAFLDMDDIIVERQGKDISRIFAEDGEPFFRQLERELVGELARRDGLVIATGGGVVLNDDNITDFRSSGVVICLSADPNIILERVTQETHRPLLEGDEKIRRILEILEARQGLYNAIPHQIDTTHLTVDEVVAQVVRLYRG